MGGIVIPNTERHASNPFEVIASIEYRRYHEMPGEHCPMPVRLAIENTADVLTIVVGEGT